MKQFVDNAGRSWGITINVDTIRRVRDVLSVDLLAAVEGKLIERLVNDPILLCDVIYVICKSEADLFVTFTPVCRASCISAKIFPMHAVLLIRCQISVNRTFPMSQYRIAMLRSYSCQASSR